MSDYCTTKYDARQSNIVSWFTSVLFFLYANEFMTGIKEIKIDGCFNMITEIYRMSFDPLQ